MRLASALPFALLLGTSIATAQVRPVDCPTVYDSADERLGLVVDAVGKTDSLTLPATPVNPTMARVAMTDGTDTFLLLVTRDALMGSSAYSNATTFRYLSFSGDDCTGEAFIAVHEARTHRDVQGPFPPTFVFGAADTLYVADMAAPQRTDVAVRSFGVSSMSPADGTETDFCLPSIWAAPRGPVHPVRRVGDLSAQFTPPFRVDDGPCPRGNGNGGGGGRP